MSSDIPDAMDQDDITLQDLQADEAGAAVQLPVSFEQLLSDGFPAGGGIEALLAISRMQHTDARSASLQYEYRKLLKAQQRPL